MVGFPVLNMYPYSYFHTVCIISDEDLVTCLKIVPAEKDWNKKWNTYIYVNNGQDTSPQCFTDRISLFDIFMWTPWMFSADQGRKSSLSALYTSDIQSFSYGFIWIYKQVKQAIAIPRQLLITRK